MNKMAEELDFQFPKDFLWVRLLRCIKWKETSKLSAETWSFW